MTMNPKHQRARSGRDRAPHQWEGRILRLIGEHRAVPIDLLADLLAVDRWVAVRLMTEFAGRRWINHRQFFVKDDTWVWLREAGAERCGVPYTAGRPRMADLPQLRALCEVRLLLRAEHPEGRWICQRDLLGADSGPREVPSAVLELPNPGGSAETWAVEVERTERRDIFREHLIADRCTRFDRLLYYCRSAIAERIGTLGDVGNPNLQVTSWLWEGDAPDPFGWRLSPASSAAGPLPRGRLRRWEAAILRLIAEQEAIPVDQLASMIGRDVAAAQAVANHLDRSGLVRQGLGPLGEKPWVWVSPAACRRMRVPHPSLEPSVLDTAELRLNNEARRYVTHIDPRGKWLSRRVLRGGSFEELLPAGVVRSGGQEYAVEVEPESRDRKSLIDKYERRHAEHASDGRRLLVLCSSANRAVLEELKEQCGWLDLVVEVCPSFEKRPRPARPPSAAPLQQVSIASLPRQVMRILEAREIEPVPPAPVEVKLAAKRRGPDGSRWRITTERNVWGVFETPLGWWLWPADETERDEDVLPPAPADNRKAPSPKRSTFPLVLIDLEELHPEVLRKVREREETDAPPEVIEVAKRRGHGSRRWRITTKRGVWLVTHSGAGWRIWESPRAEREEEAIPPPPRQRRQGKRKRELVEVKVESLPPEAFQLVQVKENLSSPPEVKFVAKTKGRGARRWRITTERDVWCVTRTPVGWWIWQASEEEKAEKVVAPKRPKRKRPARKPKRKKEKPKRGDLVDEPVHAVPPEAVAAVQRVMGVPSPPKVNAAKRRHGGGSARWHLETADGWWRVTTNPERTWLAKPEGSEPEGVTPAPLDPPGTMKDVDPSALPAGGVEAIRRAAGSPFPPHIKSLAQRRGKGSRRWRAVTDLGIWRVTLRSSEWKAVPSE